jgi:hypothetical protein
MIPSLFLGAVLCCLSFSNLFSSVSSSESEDSDSSSEEDKAVTEHALRVNCDPELLKFVHDQMGTAFVRFNPALPTDHYRLDLAK